MEIREKLDLHPSFAEVQAAKAVFLRWMKEHEDVIALPDSDPQHMSRNVAMSCALAEVCGRDGGISVIRTAANCWNWPGWR